MPLLFSYVTLHQETVQIATFGRVLRGRPDVLVGFALSTLKIEDPAFVATSGKSEHAVVMFSGKDQDRVTGMVFEVTDAELASSDAYEPTGYARVPGTLASGAQVWVYARA